MCRRLDAAVALAPEMEHELRALGFTGPVWTIPNFRDPERFVAVDRAAASTQLRAELGLSPEPALLGLVGHLIEQKRPERAARRLARVHAIGADAHLVVAGTGPLETAFVAAARAGAHPVRASARPPRIRRDGARCARPAVAHQRGRRHPRHRDRSADGRVPGGHLSGRRGGDVSSTTDTPVWSWPRADPQLMADAVVQLLGAPEARHTLGLEGRRRAEQFSTARAAAAYRTHLATL